MDVEKQNNYLAPEVDLVELKSEGSILYTSGDEEQY